MKLKQIIVSIILFSLFLFICSAVFKGTADNLQADSALTAESEVSSMGESNIEITEMNLENLKEIYFAGGCFWGVEEYFSRIPGVYDAVSGYANGNTEQRPTKRSAPIPRALRRRCASGMIRRWFPCAY